MSEAVLSLGANLGDREKNLKNAVDALNRLPGTRVKQCSSLYETEPFGVGAGQPAYLNVCLQLETALSPHALLGACLGIEASAGRERIGVKSARVLDIDVLLYDALRQDEPELTLPHPRMMERAFVLVPLLEIYPEGEALGVSFQKELKGVDRSGVRLFREKHF